MNLHGGWPHLTQPLGLLAGVVAVAAAWFARRLVAAWHATAAARLAPAPRLRQALPSRSRLSLSLEVGGLLLIGLALARPQGEGEAALAARSSRDLLVALDLSRSMRTRDVGESRLARAKSLASRLVRAVPGTRAGLIIFGGSAYLQLPLTSDLDAFERFVDAASPEDIDDPATDVAAALKLAATTFGHDGGEGHRAVLLVSDGERNEGPIAPAFEALRGGGIPVLLVGVGTEEGGFVPGDSARDSVSAQTPWHLDHIGRPVLSQRASADMQRIADETGGVYAAWDDPSALGRVVAAIEALPARAVGAQRVRDPAEWFQVPLALALLLLGVRPWLEGQRRAPTQLAVVGAAALVGCGGAVPLWRGVYSYRHQAYEEALGHLRQAVRERADPLRRYNLGLAEYRLLRYEDAIASFRAAAAGAGGVHRRAMFNLGNAYLRAVDDQPTKGEYFDRAIEAYEEALRVDPTDRDAKWNLELALRKQREHDPGGSPGRGGRAQAGRGESREEGLDAERETAIGAMAGGGSGDVEGESAEELDEAKARALLEAIERRQLASHEGRRSNRGDRGGKDW